MRLMQDLKSLLLANDMQFILSKNIQNTKETLQVPSGADASARATVGNDTPPYKIVTPSF